MDGGPEREGRGGKVPERLIEEKDIWTTSRKRVPGRRLGTGGLEEEAGKTNLATPVSMSMKKEKKARKILNPKGERYLEMLQRD